MAYIDLTKINIKPSGTPKSTNSTDTFENITRQYLAVAAGRNVGRKEKKKNDSGIVTASDEKKSKTKSPEIKALGAGDYGADKDTRADNVLKGATQATAASYVNAAGTLSGGTGELTMGESIRAARDGKSIQELEAEKEKRQDKIQEKLYGKADKLNEKSQANIEEAKDGLGTVGQTLVDVGVAGTQMLGDAALNIAVPGAGLVGMGLRSFGSGAQEQRQKGGTETDMLLGGLKSAAIEVLTEKIGGPFEKVYGKTWLGKTVSEGIETLGKSSKLAGVLKFVAKGGSEAVEEIISDVLNPIADSLLNLSDSAMGEAVKEPWADGAWRDTIHDGIVGGILGLAGAGGQVVSDKLAANSQTAETAQNATQAVAAENSQTTPTAEANADTAQQAQLNSMPQGKTTAEQTNPIVAALNYSDNNPITQLNNIDNAKNVGYNTIENGGELNGQGLLETLGAGLPGRDGYNTGIEGSGADGRGDIQLSRPTALSENARQTINQRGIETIDIPMTMDSAAFSVALSNSKNANATNGWAVTEKSPEELANTKTYLSNNGASGFAIADGDIEAVFANKSAGAPRGTLASLMPQAIAAGGVKLDCYGDTLVNMYSKYGGMRPVCRVEFNEEYANDGWTPDKGKPYIYFMIATDTDADAVAAKQGTYPIYSKAELDSLPTFGKEEYDEAFAFRDDLLANNLPADDGLGAANLGFTENMDVATSQYRTNSMERNYDPELLDDNGFEVESGNFDHKIKHNADTMTTAQTMFDYYMEDGGIDAVKEAIFDDSLSGAERGTLAEIAQQYLAEQERNALYDNEVTAEEYEKLVNDRLEIAKEKSALLTEAGQTLQAQTMWNRSDDPNTVFGEASDALAESGLDAAEQKARLRQLDGWLTRLEDINPKSKQAMGEMKSLIKEIADKRGVTRLAVANSKTAPIANTIIDWALDRLDYNQLKQLTMNSAQQSVFDLTLEADVGQKIKAVQVIFMLSRPKTLNRNLFGNGSFSAVDTISMNGAALADMLMSQVTGTRSVAADKWLFSQKARNGMKDAAVKSIAEIMLDANMGAENRYQMTSSRTFKADGGMVERIFSVLERENALRMVMTDEVAKASTRERSKEEIQRLVDEGKIKGADENYAQEYADYLAKERTFQQDSGIADVISQLHDALNAWIGVGDSGRTFGKKGHVVHSFGAGDIVAPFTKVAGNLASTAYNYSTAKAVRGFVRMCNVLYDAQTNGTVDPAKQAKAVKEFARGVNGTAFTLICFALAKANLLKRADDEDDADVAALNAAEGMTGTQLNIDAIGRLLKYGDSSWQTDDKLLDISSLEPLNTLMAVGTVAANWNEDSTVGNIFSVLDTFGESVEELPVLQFKANVDEDVKYGDKRSEAIAKEGINTVISSIIPNIVSGVASGADEYYRDIYSGDTYGQNVADNVKSRIPGLRQTLPIKQTPMGENKAYSGSPLGIFLNAMVNPVGVNTYTQGNVSSELEEVRQATGRVTFYPDKTPPKEIEANRETYSLSYEERQKYQQTAGKYYQREADRLIGKPGYNKLNDEQKGDVLDLIRKASEEKAKNSYLKSIGKEGGTTNQDKLEKYIELAKDDGTALKDELEYSEAISGYSTNKDKIHAAVKAGVSEDKIVADFSDTAREQYNGCKKAGVGVDEFADISDFYQTGKTANAKAKGTEAKDEFLDYINSLDMSAKSKKEICLSFYKTAEDSHRKEYHFKNGAGTYNNVGTETPDDDSSTAKASTPSIANIFGFS